MRLLAKSFSPIFSVHTCFGSREHTHLNLVSLSSFYSPAVALVLVCIRFLACPNHRHTNRTQRCNVIFNSKIKIRHQNSEHAFERVPRNALKFLLTHQRRMQSAEYLKCEIWIRKYTSTGTYVMLAGPMFSRIQPVNIADKETIGLFSIQLKKRKHASCENSNTTTSKYFWRIFWGLNQQKVHIFVHFIGFFLECDKVERKANDSEYIYVHLNLKKQCMRVVLFTEGLLIRMPTISQRTRLHCLFSSFLIGRISWLFR